MSDILERVQAETNRQKQYDILLKENYKIELTLNYDDCEDVTDVIEATCKLLIDNFDIAHEGTYIKEIIEQACYESRSRSEESRS